MGEFKMPTKPKGKILWRFSPIGTSAGNVVARITSGIQGDIEAMLGYNPPYAQTWSNAFDTCAYNTHKPSLEEAAVLSGGRFYRRGMYHLTQGEGAGTFEEGQEAFLRVRDWMEEDAAGCSIFAPVFNIGEGNTGSSAGLEAIKIGLDAGCMVVPLIIESEKGDLTEAQADRVDELKMAVRKLPVKVLWLQNDWLTDPNNPWRHLSTLMGYNLMDYPVQIAYKNLILLTIYRLAMDSSKLKTDGSIFDGWPGNYSLGACEIDSASDKPKAEVERIKSLCLSTAFAMDELPPPKVHNSLWTPVARVDAAYVSSFGAINSHLAREFRQSIWNSRLFKRQPAEPKRLKAEFGAFVTHTGAVAVLLSQSDRSSGERKPINLPEIGAVIEQLRFAERTSRLVQPGQYLYRSGTTDEAVQQAFLQLAAPKKATDDGSAPEPTEEEAVPAMKDRFPETDKDIDPPSTAEGTDNATGAALSSPDLLPAHDTNSNGSNNGAKLQTPTAAPAGSASSANKAKFTFNSFAVMLALFNRSGDAHAREALLASPEEVAFSTESLRDYRAALGELGKSQPASRQINEAWRTWLAKKFFDYGIRLQSKFVLEAPGLPKVELNYMTTPDDVTLYLGRYPSMAKEKPLFEFWVYLRQALGAINMRTLMAEQTDLSCLDEEAVVSELVTATESVKV
jgi:hypothetical protein